MAQARQQQRGVLLAVGSLIGEPDVIGGVRGKIGEGQHPILLGIQGALHGHGNQWRVAGDAHFNHAGLHLRGEAAGCAPG